MHLDQWQKIEKLLHCERESKTVFCKRDEFNQLSFDFFRTAIKSLGESTFEKVHDYLVQQRKLQRTDPTLEDSTITQGLKSLVPKLSDGFLVDQLVFLEIFE